MRTLKLTFTRCGAASGILRLFSFRCSTRIAIIECVSNVLQFQYENKCYYIHKCLLYEGKQMGDPTLK